MTHLGTAQWGKVWSPERSLFVSGTFARSDGWYSYFDGDPHAPSGPLGVLEPSYSLIATGRYDGWFIQYWRLAQDIGPREQSRERHNYVDSIVIRHKHDFSDVLSGMAEFSLDHRRMTRRGDFWWRQYLYKAEAGIRYVEGKHNFAAGIQTSFADNGNNFAKVVEKINGTWTTYRAKAIHDKVSTIIGAYVSEEYELTDKIKLVGALRADHSNITQSHRLHFSPRAAIIVRPAERWVLKAMYNSAIQFPDPAHSELAIWGNEDRGFAGWGAGQMADKPERLDAYELQSIHYIGNSRLAVNVFYQNLRDVIAWYKPWMNMADLSGYGLEADFRWPVNDRFTFWSNASLQRTKIDMRDKPGLYSYRDQYSTPSEYVVGVPDVTANAGFDVKVTDDITFTTTVQYVSEMEYKRKWNRLRRSHPDEFDDWDVIRHEVYVDMSVLWEDIGIEGLDFRVTARNILGNRHLLPRQREVGDYAPEGASIFGTLSFSW